MFINFIIILHIKHIFHLHIGFCHFCVIFCPVWKRNGSVRCKYFIMGPCSDEHKAIKGKMAQSINQTMTQGQWRYPILGARYDGIPVYRLMQQITPRSPSTTRDTANNTPQPQCGHMEAEAGVEANCRSNEASVGWTSMLSSWVVVGTANKSDHELFRKYTLNWQISFIKNFSFCSF